MGMLWIIWIFSYNNQKASFCPPHLLLMNVLEDLFHQLQTDITTPQPSQRTGVAQIVSPDHAAQFLTSCWLGVADAWQHVFCGVTCPPNRKQLKVLTYLLENRFFARTDQTLWRRFCKRITTCFDFWHLHKEELYMFLPPLCTESPSLPPALLWGN